MKRAFLWAFLTWLGAMLLSLVVCFAGRVTLDPERVGELGSRIGLFLGLVVFVFVSIREANRRKHRSRQPTAPPVNTPEKLKPIDYSHLAHIFDDRDRKA